jgi:hypothetical protein
VSDKTGQASLLACHTRASPHLGCRGTVVPHADRSTFPPGLTSSIRIARSTCARPEWPASVHACRPRIRVTAACPYGQFETRDGKVREGGSNLFWKEMKRGRAGCHIGHGGVGDCCFASLAVPAAGDAGAVDALGKIGTRETSHDPASSGLLGI